MGRPGRAKMIAGVRAANPGMGLREAKEKVDRMLNAGDAVAILPRTGASLSREEMGKIVNRIADCNGGRGDPIWTPVEKLQAELDAASDTAGSGDG